MTAYTKMTKAELIELVKAQGNGAVPPIDKTVPAVTDNTAKIALRAQLKALGKEDVAANLDLSESALRAHLNTALAAAGLRVISDEEVARPAKAPSRSQASRNRRPGREAKGVRATRDHSILDWGEARRKPMDHQPAGVHTYYQDRSWTWFRPMKRPTQDTLRQAASLGWAWSENRKEYYLTELVGRKKAMRAFGLR